MKITILKAGYCSCPEHIAIKGGRWKNIRFPAMFALFEHPRFGAILYDTGYSYHFLEETEFLPNRIYRWLTPVSVREDELAVNQLSALNLRPGDISYVIISHFHADHISALKDFKTAQFIYLPQAIEIAHNNKGVSALSKASLPGLIPGNFFERSMPIDINRLCSLPPEFLPFSCGYDLFGDRSLIGVELPGHANGQMGLIATANNQTFFFIADAAWLSQAIEKNCRPNRIANLIFSNSKTYDKTLSNLHTLHTNNPGMHIIPSHCQKTLERYTK